MDLWFYPQKYEKFSKKRLSRLLIRCRPAVPLRIAGHPRFRPCAGSPSRSAVSPRRAGPPRCRAERVPGRSGNGPAIVRYGRGGDPGAERPFPAVLPGFRRIAAASGIPRRIYFLAPCCFFSPKNRIFAARNRHSQDVAQNSICAVRAALRAVERRRARLRWDAGAGRGMRHAVRTARGSRSGARPLLLRPPMSVRRPVWPPLSEPRSPCTARRSVSARWITTSSRWGIF